jgi:hypothetical protein
MIALASRPSRSPFDHVSVGVNDGYYGAFVLDPDGHNIKAVYDRRA